MSNDGNKSTKRAPFTMFSSSAGGGYLDSFHTNFSGGVEINNLHTDVYGNYRNPPAQGPFNDDLVGGLAYRHQDIGTTPDRQEGFLINAETGSLSILQTGRVQIYRDEYAKRPLNIRNIKEVSGALGNYEKEYEVVQIAGRTLNPRHFVEFSEQYTTDYPLHKGTENPVFNALDADGNPQTGSLSDYTLPDMTGSTDQFVFVNKFSAPGDRYTMSRGFLNPKGEEMSAYNASPFRNLNVRAELSADLSRHTPKATDIPPEANTEYHTTNRNVKVGLSAINENKKIIKSDLNAPTMVFFDSSQNKIYWYNSGTNEIKRTDPEGTVMETIATLAGKTVFDMAPDFENRKIYYTNYTDDTIERVDMEPDSDSTKVVLISSLSNPFAIKLDVKSQKMYWTEYSTKKIYRADMTVGATADLLYSESITIYGLAIDPDINKLYWMRNNNFMAGTLDGSKDPEVISGNFGSSWFISLEPKFQRIYFGSKDGGSGTASIRYRNLKGTISTSSLIESTTSDCWHVFVDSESQKIFWTDHDLNTLECANIFNMQYDDGNVTHAIPQSTLQYTWIKDSAETTRADLQGYATGSGIQFYSSSIDFDDSPMNSIYIDPVNATQSFDFTGSVYTYGTWKEIRGGELGLSRYYRNHNILPVTNDEDNTTQYIEPPVVAKHQPLDYNLAIDGTLTPYSIKSPYGNMLMRYSNDDINKLYDFRVSDKNTEYTKIKDLYLNKSIADAGNPVKAFYSLTYGETVYPQSKNAFMKKVRVRGEYTEVAGTGNNGYDRLYGTQNTFYSTTKQRTNGALNSQGFAADTSYTAKTYTESFIDGTNWANYSSMLGRDNTSGVVNDAVSGSNCFVFGGQEDYNTRTRYLLFKQPVVGNFTASLSGMVGPYAPLSLSGTLGANGIFSLFAKSASLGDDNLADMRSWHQVTQSSATISEFSRTSALRFYFEEPVNVMIAQDAANFRNYDDTNLALKDLEINYTPSQFKNFDAFQAMGTDGDKSFFQTASFDRNVGELNSDTDTSVFQEGVQPSLSHFEESNLTINHIIPGVTSVSPLDTAQNTQVLSGYNERLIEDISSKQPSYETYDDYAENEKPVLKEASIIPEFRISEHMPYYINENAGNFRAENKKFLSLLGTEKSSSADSRTSTFFNKEFEQNHLITGQIENIKKLKEDHIGHSKPSKITVKATGIQKLLPYNGFYPDARTVQLGNTLSSSLSPGIKSYKYNTTSIDAGTDLSTEKEIGYFGFLKTMSSPGILHNSLKSGVSVDYPAYLTPPTMQNEQSSTPTGDMKLLSAPEVRLPFESLYNLEQGLPKNKSIYPVFSGDKLQDRKEASPFYFQWDGTKRPSYELAMHNFLAESVKFFLKGSSLNTFISQPESKFLEVEADKKYYMDVVLDDQTERNKFLNIIGEAEAFPFYKSMLTEAQDLDNDFGYDTDVVHDNNGGYYSIVGAPGFPNNTDEGKIVVTHVDSAGTKTVLFDSLSPSSSTGDRFGEAVTICSGSAGVYFAAAAPDPASTNGAAYFYRYRDSDAVTEMTPSQSGTGSPIGFGSKLASLYDETDSLVYFAALDSSNAGSGHNINMYLYSCATAGTAVATLHVEPFVDANKGTDPNGANPRDYLGIDLTKIEFDSATNNRILFAASSQKYDSTNKGAVVVNYWNTSTLAHAGQDGPFHDLTAPTTTGWGSDISIVETSNNGSVSLGYVAVGRANTEGSGLAKGGSVSLYETELTTPADFNLSSGEIWNNAVVSLGPSSAIGVNDWGQHVSLNFDSLSEELLLSVAQPFWGYEYKPASFTTLGAIEVQAFKKKSDTNGFDTFFPTGTLRNFIDPTYDNQAIMNPRFGSSMNTDLVNHELLIAAGSPEYSASFSAGGISHVLYSSGSTQDYKQHGKLYGFPVDGTYDPAYCAYTPPGFYGEATARISFSSSTPGPVTLEEIFKDARIENIVELEPSRQRVLTGSAVTSLTTLQDSSKMNISSSIALFERVINPGVEFNISEDGAVTTANKAVPSTKDAVRWAISTKYECPVINLSSSDYSQNYTSFDPIISASFLELNTGTISYEPPQSTWTSYSNETTTNRYNFTLKESFNKNDVITAQTGSLIDLCGFTSGVKNIGTVADNKTITEAIMVIPYTERAIPKKTVEIEKGKHFFRLNASELKRQNKSIEDNGFAVSEDIRETSISELLSAMKSYVIPPHYNFLSYKDIKPFAAYFLEFEHTLTQKDLSDIWQGVTPSISVNPQTEEVEISHDLDKHNMLHNIDIPNDIKFMVFKVKKKAEWNYYNITTDSTDDDRFRFDFQGNGKVEVVPEYSYNWPYDYFSLVERAKVAVDFTFKKPEEDE